LLFFYAFFSVNAAFCVHYTPVFTERKGEKLKRGDEYRGISRGFW